MYGSILLPVRNGQRYIERALNSVVSAAGGQAYELLVQDARSTDGTRQIVEGHPANIRYVCEADSGQTDALNRALSRSKGDFVGWLNADDLYLPRAIQVAASVFEKDPTADVVYGDWQIIDDASDILREHSPGPWSWRRLYTKGNYIFSGATFFRRDVFEKFGFFNTEYEFVADLEFFLRIGRSVRAVNAHRELGAFRYHTASKTGSQRFRFCVEAASLRRLYRPASPYGWLAYAHAQSLLWVSSAVAPLRYTEAYSRARKTAGRCHRGHNG